LAASRAVVGSKKSSMSSDKMPSRSSTSRRKRPAGRARPHTICPPLRVFIVIAPSRVALFRHTELAPRHKPSEPH
jgi:hypothetical protein